MGKLYAIDAAVASLVTPVQDAGQTLFVGHSMSAAGCTSLLVPAQACSGTLVPSLGLECMATPVKVRTTKTDIEHTVQVEVALVRKGVIRESLTLKGLFSMLKHKRA